MSTEVEPSDWEHLDPWWSAYRQTQLVTRSSASALDRDRLADCWDELDPWWRAYADTSPHVRTPATMRALAGELLTGSWDELDPWWDIYTETGHETAVELANLLERSNEEWAQSAAPFDTDPLASAVTSDQGPLLPSNEEGWSDWLARLLRPSAALVTELFDVEIDQCPDEVIREDRLVKEDDSHRRPDILIIGTDRGVSIEVKLDDPDYGKTEETAGLIECGYPRREWTHTLLLPKRNIGNLRSSVELSDRPGPGERPQIGWEKPAPVSVVYWGDVTAAIRSLLLRGDAVDDHWAANAYLFCAAVEQQIMNFQPQPVIDDMACPANVLDTIQPISLAGVLGQQLTFLRERQEL